MLQTGSCHTDTRISGHSFILLETSCITDNTR